ncbi:MAG: hypothetical protein J6P71_02285 [Oscillospiraceae bacterium]|nr:hypothetical protein [Oscillospiraceae bacterium]
MKITNKETGEKSEVSFSYWFRNVLVYYYGKWILAGILAIGVIVFICLESTSTKIKYAFQMGVIVSGGISYESTEELRGLVEKAVGDVNGNGSVDIDVQIVNLGDVEQAEANQYKVMLLMSQHEYTLYLLDDELSRHYSDLEYFDDLRNYGFTPDPDNPYRIDVTEAAVIQDIASPYEYYACLFDWAAIGKGKQERTDAALRVIEALIND